MTYVWEWFAFGSAWASLMLSLSRTRSTKPLDRYDVACFVVITVAWPWSVFDFARRAIGRIR